MNTKTYVSKKIAVIAGIFCHIGKELELTDKAAAPYLEKEFIVLKEEVETSTTGTTIEGVITAPEGSKLTDPEMGTQITSEPGTPLSVAAILEMDYNTLKANAAALAIQTEDQKADTLRAALIAHVEKPVEGAE